MPYTVKPLLVGVRNVDQGILTYQRGYGKRIWLPMWAFLIREITPGQDGKAKVIIVDTGLEDFVTPPEFTEETGLTPSTMEEALAAEGLTPDDVDIVINTHLHDDHCGNNPLFPNAKFYIQAQEIESCKKPHPLDYRYDESFIDGLDIIPVQGELEPLPGLKLIPTPGHTPGGQAVQVDTNSGQVVIPGFCCCRENFPKTSPAVCPGVHANAYQAYDNAQKVKAMEGHILPLHELDIAGKTF